MSASAGAHTPGLLSIDRFGLIRCGDKMVASTTGHQDNFTPDLHEINAANAARLVACWNACEGIPTDALSLIGAVASGNAANNMHVEAERDSLRADVEALRAALEDITGLTASGIDDVSGIAFNIARAALTRGAK